jgi:uncharacterized glyoxalase superfamily protein PhnB
MSTDPGAGTSIVYSLAPMLSVRRGARTVEFYKSAFGAIEVFRIDAPDGAVVARLPQPTVVDAVHLELREAMPGQRSAPLPAR